jgi:hypothetical protein
MGSGSRLLEHAREVWIAGVRFDLSKIRET